MSIETESPFLTDPEKDPELFILTGTEPTINDFDALVGSSLSRYPEIEDDLQRITESVELGTTPIIRGMYEVRAIEIARVIQKIHGL